MDKAILVIDMPSCCNECKIRVDDEYSNWCPYDNPEPNGVWKYVDNGTKPDWCPLKPVPKKLDVDDSIYYQWGDHEDGWNHCIDCIVDE